MPYLVRDVLDKPLVDEAGHHLGTVDDIVLEIDDAGPPRVVAIEQGFAALARRLGRPFAALARVVARRIGPRHGETTRIAWSDVRRVGTEVEIAPSAARARGELLAGESWAERLVSHIPGA